MSDRKISELSIFEKIQMVSNEVGNIEKDMMVGKGSYAYKAVSDYAVTDAVKKAETKYRLLSMPLKQELVSSEVIKTLNNKGEEKLTFHDNIKMTVRIYDLDKEGIFVDIETFGKGIDSNDKGFGKASTYARKYALLNAYKIQTGEDPDKDKSPENKSVATLDDRKKVIFNYFEDHEKARVEILKHFNVAVLNDLNKNQVNTIYDTYKKKGLI